MNATKDNKALTLNLALNYGGRSEIVDAVRKIAIDVKEGNVSSDDIDERLFAGYLYTKDLPDPDLLIRTSGESRVSNFLLWQISYSEIYIAKKLWPDFKKEILKRPLRNIRQERGGSVDSASLTKRMITGAMLIMLVVLIMLLFRTVYLLYLPRL